MGIDYDSRLIFGWEIDYKTMYSYAEKQNIDICELNYIIEKRFPNVYFVYTNPYYDVCDDEKHYYISLIEDTKKGVTLDQMSEAYSQNYESAILFMKNELNIEISKPPMIYAVYHIW